MVVGFGMVCLLWTGKDEIGCRVSVDGMVVRGYLGSGAAGDGFHSLLVRVNSDDGSVVVVIVFVGSSVEVEWMVGYVGLGRSQHLPSQVVVGNLGWFGCSALESHLWSSQKSVVPVW